MDTLVTVEDAVARARAELDALETAARRVHAAHGVHCDAARADMRAASAAITELLGRIAALAEPPAGAKREGIPDPVPDVSGD